MKNHETTKNLNNDNKIKELNSNHTLNLNQNSSLDSQEIIDSSFSTKKIDEDNTRFGDWVISGRTIDF
jgi:hypothetical protein